MGPKRRAYLWPGIGHGSFNHLSFLWTRRETKCPQMQNDDLEKLVPLKSAAHCLNLTPEGLRQRLLRLGLGIRKGGRWYITIHLIEEMRLAAQVLGVRR
jgi:hypothetical protein